MPLFHHLWVVQAQLEVANPGAGSAARCAALLVALERYASDETTPYPTLVASADDCWVEIGFPVWSPTRWAAVAAGATVLSEACASAGVEVGVVRLAAGESADELEGYRTRVHAMEGAEEG